MRKRIRMGKALLLAVLIVCAALPILSAQAALKRGSTGDDVSAVQRRLKQWGYYSGAVDGIFGYATERAVKWFQEKNGLTVDGVVGPKTAAAMGLNLSSTVSASTKPASGDVYLLAQCIYSESRGEPYKGQVAVGAVVLNRVKSSSFPNSVSGVIYQQIYCERQVFKTCTAKSLRRDVGGNGCAAGERSINHASINRLYSASEQSDRQRRTPYQT